MPKRNGTAAGGFAEQSSDSVFKSSKKYFLPDGRQQRRDREFEKIAIVASSGDYASPCGICRQVLAEFMPEGKVLLYSEEKGMVTYTVRELLPMGFRKEDIR